ncbi:MAG: helix-turn-helix transcriptional regulator [Finegoldia magna]|jgi:transcriptional regulator with XRE-family HTH domain|nr:helix-turn-helix transcriptional regulator [Finegoldia magna]MBS5942850.1 helix-turn-helix transcriptional regulator [Finegoldia magna]
MARKPAEMTEVEQRAITILRDSFEQSKMTHGELAEKVGVARTTILKTFAGSRATYLSEFEGIAKALGLTPWRVMRQAEDALEAAPSNVLRFPATSRQENQREADAMLAEQRYAASQLRDGEEDADQYPEWD